MCFCFGFVASNLRSPSLSVVFMYLLVLLSLASMFVVNSLFVVSRKFF